MHSLTPRTRSNFPNVMASGRANTVSSFQPLLKSLKFVELASESVNLRYQRLPSEGVRCALGGSFPARVRLAPVEGWGSPSVIPSRHHVASSSGAAPRRTAPRARLALWAGACVLLLSSCTHIAPVVRCVPDSLYMGCKK